MKLTGLALMAFVATAFLHAVCLAGPQRNVLLLIADDLGMDHLGCYGHPNLKTPRIDALAAQGTRFTHAFATTASCSPSRSVIFTGLHNHANGQYGLAHAAHNFHQRPNIQTVFQLLKAHGFHTGLIGKKHVLPESSYPIDFEPPVNAKDAASMGRQATRFLADTAGKPFFLVAGFTDPHRPFRAPAGAATGRQARKKGAQAPGPLRATYDPAAIAIPDYLPDIPEVRRDVADYYACVSRLDDCVGAVLDALRQSGRESETLVVFLSDNGMPVPGAKTTTYEPGIRLPFIVRVPQAANRGVANRAMISYVDVLPTILEWTAVASPSGYKLHGRSIVSIVGEVDPPGWDQVYCSHTFHEVTMYYPMRVVRDRKFKLIWNLAAPLEFPFASDLFGSPTWQATLANKLARYGKRPIDRYLHRPEFELYNLESDPGELHNLATDPEHAATLADLKVRLFRFQDATDDPWKVKQVRQ